MNKGKGLAAGILITIAVFTIGVMVLLISKKKPDSITRVQTMISSYSIEDGTALSILAKSDKVEIEVKKGEFITIPDEQIITATDDKGKEFSYRDLEDIKTKDNPSLITKHHLVFEYGTNASTIQQTDTGYHVILIDGSVAEIPFEEVEYVKLS